MTWRLVRTITKKANPWHDLAVYNAEVHRGIVHTPEYDERMAEEQRRFDELGFWPDERGRWPGHE
jgi:hypothetical protein